MAALKEQARQLRTRQVKLGAAVALALAAGYAFVARPTANAIATVQADTETLRAQLAKDQERASKLPVLRAEVRALGEQVKRFRSLPPRGELDSAFKEIGALCERSGVKSHEFNQQAERRDKAFVEQPCKLTFTGNFVTATTLVNKLETTDWLSRLRTLHIRRADAIGNGSSLDQSGEVKVELTLNLYFAD
jgi:Tfp pilus assembly protein PilO